MSGEESNLKEIMDRNSKNSGRESMNPTRAGNGCENASNPQKFNKKWRRREGTGGSQSGPKPRGWDSQQASRRVNTFTDKRPRARGYYNDNHREEVTEDLRTEHGSVLRMGSKKTNLNHLLNFSVGHSEDTLYDTRFSGSGRGKKYYRRTSIRYNKEQFLQANCQFVVKESADYSVNAADPDILVDWDLIEQVKIFGNEVPSCPICLYPPVVAKMTRCGHIFCWSCILHYLSLSDKKSWRKCPICYEAIHQKDLKSVVALESRSFKVGDEITLKLMKRDKNSTFAVPVSQWAERSKPYYVNDEVDLCFSKLLLANPDQVQAILDMEKTALEVQLAEEGESLEGSYVKSAMELLKERQVNVNLAKAAKDSVGNQLEELRQQKPKGAQCSSGSSFTPLRRVKAKDSVEYSSAFSDEEVSSEVTESTTESLALHTIHSAPELKVMSKLVSESSDEGVGSPRSSVDLSTSDVSQTENPDPDQPSGMVAMSTADGEKVEVAVEEVAEDLVFPSNEGKPEAVAGSGGSVGGGRDTASGTDTGHKKSNAFYFYQSVDGQHIYLHSVNARCLVREYGSLEASPLEVTARIVEVSGITMNEELRSRLRYLNHLPLTCEFKVAELALKPPVLSKETLDAFHDDIEKRRRLRNRKQRVETNQLKKRQQEEIKKYEGTPEMKLMVSNSSPYQEFSTKIVQSDMPSLLAHTDSPVDSVSPELMTPVGSPSNQEVGVVGSVASDEGGQSSMSFAQMLRAGKGKSQPAWPVKQGTSADTAADTAKSGDSDNEDRVPVPLYRDSFGDAISAALQTYTSAKSDKTSHDPGENDSVDVNTAAGAAGGKGKKKKKQKKLLFVNTMARAK